MLVSPTSRSSIEPLEHRTLLAAPFSLPPAPGLFPEDFRVTTFAKGLNFPLGMQRLDDGSYLVPTTKPGSSFMENSTGQLLRLVDEDKNGKADDRGKLLADNLPGPITSVRQAGNLVFVTSPGLTQQGPASITVLRKGKRPSDRYTNLGSLNFTFPKPWAHLTYALETRPTPGQSGRHDLFFNFGSRADGVTTPADATVTIASSDGRFREHLRADSIYKLTVRDTANGPRYSDLALVAYGLRNAAGIAIHPKTGDLYFQDNGIDGPNRDPQLSADELNVIRAARIGKGAAPDFGFAHDYVNMLTAQRAGTSGVQPLVAFTRDRGIKAEGANDIAFAPKVFPPGLNNGIFVGFFGKFSGDGTINDQNPVVYYDLSSGRTVEFVSNNEPSIGHPIGLLSTDDSLFVSDVTNRDFQTAGSGTIYQIRALPRNRRVAGTVFNDKDSDGRLDRTEKGLAKVRVFADRNANGRLDRGEPNVRTKKSGAYELSLPPGRYQIRVAPPNGFSAEKDAFTINLAKRRRASGRDFALARR